MCTDVVIAAHAMRENHYATLVHNSEISQVSVLQDKHNASFNPIRLGQSYLNPSTKLLIFLGKLLCLSQFLHFAYVNYPIITHFDMENDRYGRKSSF